jgi:hypothetical protein
MGEGMFSDTKACPVANWHICTIFVVWLPGFAMKLGMLCSGAVYGELLYLAMEYIYFSLNIEFCTMEGECQEVGYPTLVIMKLFIWTAGKIC